MVTRNGRGQIVTLGEALLRLTAPRGERLESAPNLHAYVAGAEANVARTLARLGVPAVWLSAVPPSPVGERILRELRGDGVDTSFVARPSKGRVGLFFAEQADPPRGTRVWYDRDGSAFARMGEFDERALAGASFAVLSGITPALGARTRKLAETFAAAARSRGAALCLDVNYRSLLWSARAARRGLSGLLAEADVVVCAERDARAVLEAAGEPEQILRELAERWAPRAAVVVLTRRERGSLLLAEEKVIEQPAVEVGYVLDSFGAGDAFLAGLLWGLWNGAAAADALKAGATLASMKCTLAGDVAPISAAELALAADGPRDTAILR
jgi:2-dehydro-3-deoxygluconokinase